MSSATCLIWQFSNSLIRDKVIFLKSHSVIQIWPEVVRNIWFKDTCFFIFITMTDMKIAQRAIRLPPGSKVNGNSWPPENCFNNYSPTKVLTPVARCLLCRLKTTSNINVTTFLVYPLIIVERNRRGYKWKRNPAIFSKTEYGIRWKNLN